MPLQTRKAAQDPQNAISEQQTWVFCFHLFTQQLWFMHCRALKNVCQSQTSCSLSYCSLRAFMNLYFLFSLLSIQSWNRKVLSTAILCFFFCGCTCSLLMRRPCAMWKANPQSTISQLHSSLQLYKALKHLLTRCFPFYGPTFHCCGSFPQWWTHCMLYLHSTKQQTTLARSWWS